MKYTVKKVASDTVALVKEGYMPEVVSIATLFDKTLYKLNKYGIVDNVYYEEPSIIFDLIDPIYAVRYQDEVVLDESLTSDSEVVSSILKFCEDYVSKKDSINDRNSENILSYDFSESVCNNANDIFQKYCLTGNLSSLPSNAHAMRIYDMCLEHDESVYTHSDHDSYYGTTTDLLYRSTSVKRLGSASAVSIASSALFGILTGGFVAASNYQTAAILGAGCVASVIASVNLCNKKRSEITKSCCEKLDELAVLLDNKFKIEEAREKKLHK